MSAILKQHVPVGSYPIQHDDERNFGDLKITKLSIGEAGSEVDITATPSEINSMCDKSAGAVISLTGNTSVTQATHAGKVCMLNAAAGLTVTLPEATGTGDKYKFVLGTVVTSNTIVIKTADATNAHMLGHAIAIDSDAATTAVLYQALLASTIDKVTMNRTTQGGVNIGCDWYEFTDIATDRWLVEGRFLVPAGSNPATPFAST